MSRRRSSSPTTGIRKATPAAATSATSPTRSMTSTSPASAWRITASRSTGRRAMVIWPLCAPPRTSQLNCCRRARRSYRPSPGNQCPIAVSGRRLTKRKNDMSSADNRGRFVWHDLMTTDKKAASGFYAKVLGWKTQEWDKNPDYTLWVGANGMLGGLMTLPPEARAAGSHWLAYILTDNLDTSVQTVERLGGRTLKGSTDVPDVGRFAVVADPQGAAFCLFQQGGAPGGVGGGPLSNDFSWHELGTTDPEAALKFYGELCGWENTAKHDMGPMGFYYLVGMKGVEFAGAFKNTPEKGEADW